MKISWKKWQFKGFISIFSPFVIVVESVVHIEVVSGAARVWSWWNEVIKIHPIPCWWITSSSTSCLRPRAWFRFNKLIRFSLRLILYLHSHVKSSFCLPHHIKAKMQFLVSRCGVGGGVIIERFFFFWMMSPKNKCEVTSRLQPSNARVKWKRCFALIVTQQLLLPTELNSS